MDEYEVTKTPPEDTRLLSSDRALFILTRLSEKMDRTSDRLSPATAVWLFTEIEEQVRMHGEDRRE